MNSRIFSAPLCFVILLICCFGCGRSDSSPRKFAVVGDVIYDSRPLQSGRITFVPDRERGNSGPPGYAPIQDGKFDTHRLGGKHAVSGPLTILITGYGEPDARGNLPEEPLFIDFPLSAEIDSSQAKTRMQFEVPKQETRKKKGQRASR